MLKFAICFLSFLIFQSLSFERLSMAEEQMGESSTLDQARFSKESDNKNKEKIKPKIVIKSFNNDRLSSTAPVKTEVVNSGTIRRNHLNDVSQVLDNIPGITLQGLTGRLGRSAVIQGLGDDQVLVLIDGIPQLQTSSSGYDLTQIAANDIESVEVIKGGASSLYGSQAIGGVINIVTKKPTDKLQYFFDMRDSMTAEEQATNNISVPNVINTNISGSFYKFLNYKLSYGYRHQDAIDLDESTLTQDSGKTERQNASVYLSKKFKKNEVFLDYRFINETLGLQTAQPTINGYKPYMNDSATQTQSVTLGLNSKFGEVSKSKIYAHYSQISDQLNLNDDLSTPYSENLKNADLNTVMMEGQTDTSFFNDQITTLGFMYRYQFLDQLNQVNTAIDQTNKNTEVDQKNMTSFESYLQHSVVFNKLEVTPGVRFQYDSNFGENQSPSINFLYSPQILSDKKTNIRGSIGTGYRVPSLKERFFLMDHRSIGNYIINGAENLNPERSISYQLGLEVIDSQKFSFHINGFLNNVNGMIGVVSQTDSSGTTIFTYDNINEVLSRGVEVSTKINFFDKKLDLEQDLTLTKTDNLSNDLEAPFRPRAIYKARIRYSSNSKIDFIGLFRYLSGIYTDLENTQVSPAYSVLDLKLNYKYSKQMHLYAGIDNVLNETRNPALDGTFIVTDNRPAMGRLYYMGLNFTEI